MLWHIGLQFYIWLCFTVLQIKFECCQFPSIFDGVIPLLDCRILKIHSFPHFSLTRFDILSWNFAYDFVLLYYRLSLSVLNLRWFLWELCPFWKLEYWKYIVFCTFLLRALTYWAETLHMTSPILGLANAPIVETKFLELAMSLLDFSPRIPLGTFSILLCLMYKRSSSRVITLCLSGCPSVHPFSAFSSYIHRHIKLKIKIILSLPPWGRRGFKPRIRPPDPQRVVKGD